MAVGSSGSFLRLIFVNHSDRIPDLLVIRIRQGVSHSVTDSPGATMDDCRSVVEPEGTDERGDYGTSVRRRTLIVRDRAVGVTKKDPIPTKAGRDSEDLYPLKIEPAVYSREATIASDVTVLNGENAD